AERLFALADEVTGLPLRELCETGPLARLTQTEVAQPAVVATSLAALAALRACGEVALEPIAVAGHSVGEVAATCAAGALDEEATLRLVCERAEAMACACELVDGTMAAVLGLDEALVSAVCAEASGSDGAVELANVNAPGQIVISGERAAVERAIAGARAAGARRALPLTVGGPFHSRYMEPAEPRLRRTLAGVALQTPGMPLAANVSGELLRSAEQVRGELTEQVARPVRWVACLRQLRDFGCDRFLELGPGQVLTGLVKRTLPDVRAASFGRPTDLAAATALLRD
ncbi:MAG: ACP S-malonyltransferase, partial [Chloroflexi bacterium]|nr:ACP S-malonyltransferase [Chloroflexota bacterium]